MVKTVQGVLVFDKPQINGIFCEIICQKLKIAIFKMAKSSSLARLFVIWASKTANKKLIFVIWVSQTAN